MLATACVIAGFYGVVHNQISYTVSPEYFHAFKFKTFAVDPFYHNRLGASFIGFMASWWMGLIIGIPVFLLGLFSPKPKDHVRLFLKVSLLVVVITLMTGLGALSYGYYAFTEERYLPYWMMYREGIVDRLAFARAGNMHNFSYLGGFFGLFIGSIVMCVESIKLRKKSNLFTPVTN